MRKSIGVTRIRPRFNAADIRIEIAFRSLPRGIRIQTGGVTSKGSRRGPVPWRIDPCVTSGSALLFGIAPSDPATFATAVGVALVITFAGSLVPALRAVRVTPMSVLRSE